MPRAKTLLVVVCVVAVFAAVTALLWPRWAEQTPAPSAVADGLSLFGYADGGTMSWHITAESGTLVDDVGTLLNINLAFSQEGANLIEVQANELVRTSNQGVLTGNVLVKREDGLQLTTDQATWDEAGRTLVASKTNLDYDEIHASGLRFTYDLAQATATIEDQVTVTAMGEKGWYLSAERLDVNDDVLAASGAVLVEMQSGEQYACEALSFDVETEEINMTGGVDIVFSSGRITADSASVTPDGFTATSGVTLHLDLSEETGGNG